MQITPGKLRSKVGGVTHQGDQLVNFGRRSPRIPGQFCMPIYSRSGVQMESPFLLDFRVRTVQESGKEVKQQENEQKVERLGVLEGLRRYAAEHVLLAGRPGS